MAINKVAVFGAGVMGARIAAQLANAGLEVELFDIPAKTGDRDANAKNAIERMLKENPAPFMHPKNAARIRPGNTEDHLPRLADCDLIIEAVPEVPAIKAATFRNIQKHRKPGAIVASNTSTIPLQALIDGHPDDFKKDFIITHFFNPPRYQRLLELVTSEHNDPAMVAEVERFMDEKMGKGVIRTNDTPGFIANRIGTYWIQTGINEAMSRNLKIEEADALLGKPMGVPKMGLFGLVDLVGLDLMPSVSKSLMSRLPADDAYAVENRPNPLSDQLIADGYTGRKGKGGFYRVSPAREKLAIDLDTGAERLAVDVVAKPTLTQAFMKAAAKAVSTVKNLVSRKKADAKPAKKQRPKVELAALRAFEHPGLFKDVRKDGLKSMLDHGDQYSDYAWTVLKKTLAYTAEHASSIAADIVAIDEAMKLGYSWKKGPFQMIDQLGVDYVIDRLEKDGEKVPAFLANAKGESFYRTVGGQLQFRNFDGKFENIQRPDGVVLLEDIKRKSKPVDHENILRRARDWLVKKAGLGATIWDIGDGVLNVEFTSKQNSLDFFTMAKLNRAADLIEQGKYKAMVVHNEGENFSVGANLVMASVAAKFKQYWVIDKMIKTGQETYKRLKYANFPVVSAPTGFAFGGGTEILLHSNHVQAHAETYMGLVEAGVGLLPAWGGSTELMTRALKDKSLAKGPFPAVKAAFEVISTAKVAASAQQAKDYRYLRESDGITMNKSRLLADAKAKALEMIGNVAPEKPVDFRLQGASGVAMLDIAVDGFYQAGLVTPYDVVVTHKIAQVLTGGDKGDLSRRVTQDEMRALEHKHFMELVKDKRTIARIQHMMKEGKPLREKPIPGKTAAELRAEADTPKQSFAQRHHLKERFDRFCEQGTCSYIPPLPHEKQKPNTPGQKA